MATNVSSSRVQLSYPLYAADFDPFNPDFLLVGGGGGSSSTGVPNKISLIDTSRRDQLKEVVDIELAKDEDSVTSLAVADSLPAALTAFAGVNSSVADQNVGKNEHLRSFRIGLPARKRKAGGSTVEEDTEKPRTSALYCQICGLPFQKFDHLEEHMRIKHDRGGGGAKQNYEIQNRESQALGRSALFAPPTGTKNEAYQRVLRFSPTQKPGDPRLAAVASGLATQNEIVVFHPKPRPAQDDVVSRVELGTREAEDLDLAANENEKGGFLLGYCTNNEVFLQQLPITSTPEAPISLFRAADISKSLPPSQQPKFRAIRFLTPRLLLILRNKPQRSGADLLVLQVSKDGSQARMLLRKVLNSAIKAAVGLDVAPLTAVDGERQFAIAVGGIPGEQSSIEILTLDHSQSAGLGFFRSYKYLKGVHDGPVTSLAFSNFIGPALPVTGEVGPQSLRLASVGVDKSAVVHYLPLRPFPPAESKTPRYVLIPPGRSEAAETTFSVFFAIAIVGLVAFLLQAFCEIRGVAKPVLGATNWLSPRMQERVALPYGYAVSSATSEVPVAAHSAVDELKRSADDIAATLSSSMASATAGLKKLVDENSKVETPKAIIVREESLGDISTEVIHSDAQVVKDETLRKWDELSESQKKSWKRKLVDAGHWAEQQGENVLRGILFSELAGAVGNMVGGG
ncbi:hypothetical protein H2200_004708 [Cladophialophora chaetospira]|uniref:Guanine nucleotide-exchange factor SEC12 n=1 Tax=Cladophialophora chaetospira TaxID=386627 RepID=A0AA39CKQ1_9EURO|nr:hypothetical protein H2200_004708 [Cladophialophora chaetospira]